MHETARAQEAFADYSSMNISLDGLATRYRERRAAGERVPTVFRSTLARWSAAFGWQDRLAEMAQARITAIMSTGMAVVHERVEREKRVEELLFGEVMDDAKRWLPDVKQIGQGESAERVDIVRFNHRLVEQWRGLHKDLAEETGGRKRTIEHTGAGGGPIQIKPVDYRTAAAPLFTDTEDSE